jgi:hypothetical protein
LDGGAYSELEGAQTKVWTTMRNSADHGHFEQFKKENAREFLDGIRKFLGF